MFKIAVCDGEKYFQNRIKEILTEYQKEKSMQYKIETFDSGKELLDCETGIRQYKIVFLDMDDLNGILTARKIRELNEDIFIVFVTAYTKYFFNGHKMDAVRYILKDSETMSFYIYECMDAVYKKMEDKSIWKEFKFTIGCRKISLDHILYIESRLHKLEFHMLENIPPAYTLYGTLNQMEKELTETGFLRIHQSYLTNMKHITAVCRYYALLVNGTRLEIPKARYKSVEEAYSAYSIMNASQEMT